MLFRKKIAWIEDDADEIMIVVKPLIKAGFEIRVYRTYSEAIAKVKEIAKCDLILLDLIIPAGRKPDTEQYLGRKLLQELRKDHHIDLPAIVFSVVAEAGTFTDDERKELDVRLISKPVRPSVLKDEVFKLLHLPIEA